MTDDSYTDMPARRSVRGSGPVRIENKESNRRPPMAKKSTPPDQTNAEQFYYSKQMQSKTPMVVHLTDGQELAGVIEWYDRDCIKLNREGAPNLLLYKRCIKYMHKAGE